MFSELELETAVEALIKATPSGFADASAFPPAVLSGYSLPAGHVYNADVMVHALVMARAEGLTQEQIDEAVATAHAGLN